MLVLLFASPPYVALIECVLTARVDVANVATPEAFNVPVPIAVEPSLNVTVPVGTPAVWLTTVAVKVTEVLKVLVALVVVNDVVVDDFATTCDTTLETLAREDASPP